ncbi:unnamed protein product [Callosobruchus maculatus]|uniref:Uncharacterized protein n=1 Tax=Callosobruchus maculatus TaxID=64391 RepID=A0A653CIV4_CALMS|nr:unnamed protein product [Callosobruchus maculatus]
MSAGGSFVLVLLFHVLLIIPAKGSAINNDIEPTSRGLESLVGNLVSRGYGPSGVGSSQIVSFNLTNLLILILLKVVIFAASTLGFGHYGGHHYARSEDGALTMNDEEVMMFLSFLSGSPGCLQSIACKQPEEARKYIETGTLLLKLSKLVVEIDDAKYQQALADMQTARNMGLSGQSCEIFRCDSKPDEGG